MQRHVSYSCPNRISSRPLVSGRRDVGDAGVSRQGARGSRSSHPPRSRGNPRLVDRPQLEQHTNAATISAPSLAMPSPSRERGHEAPVPAGTVPPHATELDSRCNPNYKPIMGAALLYHFSDHLSAIPRIITDELVAPTPPVQRSATDGLPPPNPPYLEPPFQPPTPDHHLEFHFH